MLVQVTACCRHIQSRLECGEAENLTRNIVVKPVEVSPACHSNLLKVPDVNHQADLWTSVLRFASKSPILVLSVEETESTMKSTVERFEVRTTNAIEIQLHVTSHTPATCHNSPPNLDPYGVAVVVVSLHIAMQMSMHFRDLLVKQLHADAGYSSHELALLLRSRRADFRSASISFPFWWGGYLIARTSCCLFHAARAILKAKGRMRPF